MSLVKEVSNTEVLTGETVWFDSKKGYGFIAKTDGSGDIFVHWQNIQVEGFKCLKQGDRVSFELGHNHAGPQAINVKLVTE